MFRVSLVVAFCVSLGSTLATGQGLCPIGTASNKLICVIPQVFGPNGLQVISTTAPVGFPANFPTGSLDSLQSSIARQSALLPLASPSSGVTFSWDASAKIFTAATDSYGPILGERADTIGKNRLFLGFDYQFFKLNSIDGLNLKNLPIAYGQGETTFNGQTCTMDGTIDQQTGSCGYIRDVIVTQNRIDLQVHQFTTFVTFGLTNRIDLSMAIPILNVRMDMTSATTVSHNDSPSEFFHAFAPTTACPAPCLFNTFSNAGSSSGIGDITLRAKGTAWKGEKAGLALGVDVRLPTGDSLNFLGAGAVGVKPFIIWSYHARVSPHAFVGFETNGSSRIAGDISTGDKERLPGDLTYSGGVDFWLTKRLTMAADLVGQQVFQAPRTNRTTFTEPGQCQDSQSEQCDPSLGFLPPKVDANLADSTGAFNMTNLSLGAKVKPFSTVLITGNVLIKLNDGGLRARFVPLLGVSYTF